MLKHKAPVEIDTAVFTIQQQSLPSPSHLVLNITEQERAEYTPICMFSLSIQGLHQWDERVCYITGRDDRLHCYTDNDASKSHYSDISLSDCSIEPITQSLSSTSNLHSSNSESLFLLKRDNPPGMDDMYCRVSRNCGGERVRQIIETFISYCAVHYKKHNHAFTQFTASSNPNSPVRRGSGNDSNGGTDTSTAVDILQKKPITANRRASSQQSGRSISTDSVRSRSVIMLSPNQQQAEGGYKVKVSNRATNNTIKMWFVISYSPLLAGSVQCSNDGMTLSLNKTIVDERKVVSGVLNANDIKKYELLYKCIYFTCFVYSSSPDGSSDRICSKWRLYCKDKLVDVTRCDIALLEAHIAQTVVVDYPL